MEELADKLVSWIREQVTKARQKGAIFGLSGGVDSAVVGVLCKRAFLEDVLGLIMPCHSIQPDIEHAQAVARKFQIPTKTIPLDEVFGALVKTMPGGGVPETRSLAEANVKARLRMVSLYYMANSLRYLVVGTGNRSEISVGYFTKYGDGGVDIQPLGNLVKGQVRALAAYLGIPPQIIGKPPSGGLWEGQTDEAEMGLSYDDLDRYLCHGKADDKVRRRIETMMQASAHKRSLPPIPPFSIQTL